MMQFIARLFNTGCNNNNTKSFCTTCSNELQSTDPFCAKCGEAQKVGLSDSELNIKKKQSDIALNNDMKRLVFGWCRETQNIFKISIPFPIMYLIATFSNIPPFEFKGYSKLFKVNVMNVTNVKKTDNKEHGVIIFGNSLKRNTFKWRNFNFVFKFKVEKGTVNLMFVPPNFNKWRGRITENDIIENNLRVFRFINEYNYKYNEIIRVEIDMVKLCAYISNKSRDGNTFQIIMDLKGIDSNKIFCAFAMINPFAEFQIVDQHWCVKKKHSSHNCHSYAYSDDDDDIDILMNDNYNNVSKIAPPSPPQIPLNRLQTGLNYIGQCNINLNNNHLAICNRGLDNDIRPNEDHIICNQCNRSFDHTLIILHNCKYRLYYKLNGDVTHSNIKGVAYPVPVDIYADIFKHQNHVYLKLDINPF